MMHLAAGLMLGLAGSLHCLAMCGPLVGAMAPVLGRRAPAAAWYQLGRLLAYVSLGAIAGLAGYVVASGLGRGLAIGAGAILLLAALGHVRTSRFAIGRWITRRLSRAMEYIVGLRARRPRLAAAGVGAVNGLLPCGLVYAAALAAAATGSVVSAVVLMMAFGVGTLPAMLTVWFSSSIVPVAVRQRLRVVTPVAIAVVGLLLIGRGLGMTAHHVEAKAESEAAGAQHMHAAGQGSDEARAVRAATQAWADAFNSREPARITALYDAEAVFWGTTSPTIRTSPADIAEYFKDSKARPNVRVALGEQHVRVYGDTAINSGDYTFTDVRDGTTVANPSRFTFVYRKRDGQWWIVDHHSSRQPQP